MSAYKEDFPVGTLVRIKSRAFLESFRKDWPYHHPLDDSQLNAAGLLDRVRSVGFYHGGDVLYELENAPGTWHETCLEAEDISNLRPASAPDRGSW